MNWIAYREEKCTKLEKYTFLSGSEGITEKLEAAL